MGISNLKDLLVKLKLLDTINLKNIDKYNKKKYNYHIDLSILIFKFIYTSKSYDEFIERIKDYFNNFIYILKNIKNLIIYIDYSINERKSELRELRSQKNNNDIIKKKNEIIEMLRKSNKKYLYDIDSLLNIKKIDNKDDFDLYFKKCNKNNFQEINYIFNIENIKPSNDVDMSVLFTEVKNQKNDKDICHNCFLLCFRKTKISLIRDEIINVLENLDDNILEKIIIRKCHLRDAEIDIINYIKQKKLNNNFIISTDNDAKIFSLLYLNNKILFADLHIRINTNTSILKCNKKYSKNFSILTLFLSKNDYFPGITGLSMNTKKMLRFISNSSDFRNILFNNNLEIIDILKNSIVLIGKFFKFELIDINNIRINEIEEFLDNFNLYLSLKSEFYSKKIKIKKISKYEIFTYFYNSKN